MLCEHISRERAASKCSATPRRLLLPDECEDKSIAPTSGSPPAEPSSIIRRPRGDRRRRTRAPTETARRPPTCRSETRVTLAIFFFTSDSPSCVSLLSPSSGPSYPYSPPPPPPVCLCARRGPGTGPQTESVFKIDYFWITMLITVSPKTTAPRKIYPPMSTSRGIRNQWPTQSINTRRLKVTAQ